jgi:ankyrin repeat protein
MSLRELIDAVIGGHLSQVKSILSNDPDLINQVFSQGNTPIIYAASKNIPTVLEFLCAYPGARVDVRNTYGRTALYCAAMEGFDGVVDTLLNKAGADPNLLSSDHSSALDMALRNNHVACCKTLICHGGMFGAYKSPDMLYRLERMPFPPDELHPIQLAALHGNVSVVRAFIEYNMTLVNLADKMGRSSVHYACQGGHANVLHMLKDAGGQMDTTDIHGNSPADMAVSSGRMDVIRRILPAAYPKKGANSDVVDATLPHGRTLLHLVAKQDTNLALCRSVLDEVDDHLRYVNHADWDGYTPLHVAAEQGALETTAFLLKQRAKINHLTENLETPLFLAARGGHAKVCAVLLKSGADVSMRDFNGITARDIATNQQVIDVMERATQIAAWKLASKEARQVRLEDLKILLDNIIASSISCVFKRSLDVLMQHAMHLYCLVVDMYQTLGLVGDEVFLFEIQSNFERLLNMLDKYEQVTQEEVDVRLVSLKWQIQYCESRLAFQSGFSMGMMAGEGGQERRSSFFNTNGTALTASPDQEDDFPSIHTLLNRKQEHQILSLDEVFAAGPMTILLRIKSSTLYLGRAHLPELHKDTFTWRQKPDNDDSEFMFTIHPFPAMACIRLCTLDDEWLQIDDEDDSSSLLVRTTPKQTIQGMFQVQNETDGEFVIKASNGSYFTMQSSALGPDKHVLMAVAVPDKMTKLEFILVE